MKQQWILSGLILGFLGVAVSAASAGYDIHWTKYYGTGGSDGCYASCPAAGGGYLLAGYSYEVPAPHAGPDGFLIHTDASGNELWRSFIDAGGWECIRAIVPLQDQSGYLCTGYVIPSGTGNMDLLVAVTNNDGTPLSIHRYGGSGLDMGCSVCATTDGNYLILGSTTSFGAGEDDFYYLKVNGTGDTLWTHTHGCERSDAGYACLESNGCYYLAGSTGLYDSPGVSSGNNRDMYLVKTGQDGAVLDSAFFYIMGGSQGEFDAGYGLCSLPNGNLCMTGACSKEGSEPMNVGVVVVDPDLTLVWKRNIEPGTFYDFGYAVCSMSADSSLLLAGSLNHSDDGSSRGWIMKTDLNGNTIWTAITEEDGYHGFRAITVTEENAFLVSGFSRTTNGEGYQMTSVLMEDLQVSVPSGAASGCLFPYTIWPNPCHGELHIRYTGMLPETNTWLTLYSQEGKRIRTSEFRFGCPGTLTNTWNLTNVPEGWYLLQVSDQQENNFLRLIIN